MDGNFAGELDFGPVSNGNHEQSNFYDHKLDHFSHDESVWESPAEGRMSLTEMEREWQIRHDQFHAIGYHDGIAAGKEASAQEGFNSGFKESMHVGYNWGLVRGVTTALACLPDGLEEKLIETQEEKDKLQSLYESVHSISTTDALKLFYDDFLKNKSVQHRERAEASLREPGLQNLTSIRLENYFGELKSLMMRSPAIEVNLVLDH